MEENITHSLTTTIPPWSIHQECKVWVSCACTGFRQRCIPCLFPIPKLCKLQPSKTQYISILVQRTLYLT